MEKRRSINFGNSFKALLTKSENTNATPVLSREPPKASLLSESALDIPYTDLPGSKKLDVYLPVTGKIPYAVLVWLHGGGWYLGDKQDGIAELAEPFLTEGYAVVSVNYRLSRRVIFPAQIQDAKAAIRWVRANAIKYHFNSDKVIAGGASAGGHLAALLGTSVNVKELEDLKLGNEAYSSRVNGVVEWYGPIDFLSMDAQHLSLCHDAYHGKPDSPESNLLGGNIREMPDKCREASPLTYVTVNTPPFFIIHGKADVAVPYLQSVELAEVLEKVIGKSNVHLELVEGANHLDSALMSPDIMGEIFRFLERLDQG